MPLLYVIVVSCFPPKGHKAAKLRNKIWLTMLQILILDNPYACILNQTWVRVIYVYGRVTMQNGYQMWSETWELFVSLRLAIFQWFKSYLFFFFSPSFVRILKLFVLHQLFYFLFTTVRVKQHRNAFHQQHVYCNIMVHL